MPNIFKSYKDVTAFDRIVFEENLLFHLKYDFEFRHEISSIQYYV